MRNSIIDLLLTCGIVVALSATLTACDRSSKPEAANTPKAEAKQASESTGGTERPKGEADESTPESTSSATGDEDDRFSARVTPAEIPAGESTSTAFQILAGEGLKANLEYPKWTLELDPPRGVTFSETSFSSDSLEVKESAATATVDVTGETSGAHHIPATANFSVCNDEKCHILRDQSLTFNLTVAESADGVPNPAADE